MSLHHHTRQEPTQKATPSPTEINLKSCCRTSSILAARKVQADTSSCQQTQHLGQSSAVHQAVLERKGGPPGKQLYHPTWLGRSQPCWHSCTLWRNVRAVVVAAADSPRTRARPRNILQSRSCLSDSIKRDRCSTVPKNSRAAV